MRKIFKAFLFDLDDTLVDSSEIVYLSMMKWCEDNNVNLAKAIEIGKGGRTEDTVAMLAPHLNAQEEASEIEEHEARLIGELKAIEGAAEFLAKIPVSQWAIVTSSSAAVVDLKLSAAKLTVPQVIVTAESVTKGKPDPEPFEQAMKRMGVEPEDCLVFEDADNGVSSAIKAGCQVVVIGRNCTLSHPNIIAKINGYHELTLNGNETMSIEVGST